MHINRYYHADNYNIENFDTHIIHDHDHKYANDYDDIDHDDGDGHDHDRGLNTISPQVPYYYSITIPIIPWLLCWPLNKSSILFEYSFSRY